jgi:hypothetical protein
MRSARPHTRRGMSVFARARPHSDDILSSNRQARPHTHKHKRDDVTWQVMHERSAQGAVQPQVTLDELARYTAVVEARERGREDCCGSARRRWIVCVSILCTHQGPSRAQMHTSSQRSTVWMNERAHARTSWARMRPAIVTGLSGCPGLLSCPPVLKKIDPGEGPPKLTTLDRRTCI